MPKTDEKEHGAVFQHIRARVPMKLLPSTLSDVAAATQQELAGMLLRLNRALGGVPVSFSDVKMPETDCEIFDDQPQLHINVVCTFVVFAPQVGQHLTGVVNNIADDSVGLLMLDTFNATIPQEELYPNFTYEEKQKCWKRKGAKGESIAVGQEMSFRCTGIKSADTVVQVIGAPILSEGGGRKPKDSEDKGFDAASNGSHKSDKKKKKRKGEDVDAATGGGEEAGAGGEHELKEKEKKKKKAKKLGS